MSLPPAKTASPPSPAPAPAERGCRRRLLGAGAGDRRLCDLPARPDRAHRQLECRGAEAEGLCGNGIVGQHFSRFYTDEAVARGWPAYELQQASLTGRFEDEGWRVRKDGTTFWSNVVITAIRNDAGILTGFAKITRDLTAQREYRGSVAAKRGAFPSAGRQRQGLRDFHARSGRLRGELECRRRAHQRLYARGNRRPAFLAVLSA